MKEAAKRGRKKDALLCAALPPSPPPIPAPVGRFAPNYCFFPQAPNSGRCIRSNFLCLPRKWGRKRKRMGRGCERVKMMEFQKRVVTIIIYSYNLRGKDLLGLEALTERSASNFEL
jgi:hypothetical protein